MWAYHKKAGCMRHVTSFFDRWEVLFSCRDLSTRRYSLSKRRYNSFCADKSGSSADIISFTAKSTTEMLNFMYQPSPTPFTISLNLCYFFTKVLESYVTSSFTMKMKGG